LLNEESNNPDIKKFENNYEKFKKKIDLMRNNIEKLEIPKIEEKIRQIFDESDRQNEMK